MLPVVEVSCRAAASGGDHRPPAAGAAVALAASPLLVEVVEQLLLRLVLGPAGVIDETLAVGRLVETSTFDSLSMSDTVLSWPAAAGVSSMYWTSLAVKSPSALDGRTVEQRRDAALVGGVVRVVREPVHPRAGRILVLRVDADRVLVVAGDDRVELAVDLHRERQVADVGRVGRRAPASA